MMVALSEITDRIQAYHKTGVGWADLRDWLANRDYPTPTRYDQPTDPRTFDDDTFPYTDGTWDEINRASNWGWLTDAEYLEIVRAAERR